MNRWLHRSAVLLAAAVLGLIFIGGLVTSTHSGLAVPDWPLSYGRWLPPMTGGVFFEHGHRMIAATVGSLTVLLALFFALKEPRAWVRRAAWAAVGLVVLQGVLGGVTVLLRLPKSVSIAHACLAQAFFCLAVALAVWTSPRWTGPAPLEKAAPPPPFAYPLVAVTFLQLLLGAVLRHTGRGVVWHVVCAAVLTGLAAVSAVRLHPLRAARAGLWTLNKLFLGLLLAQVALGAGTYLLLVRPEWVFPLLAASVPLVTAHVAVGAALLGTAVVFALATYRAGGDDGVPWRRKLTTARLADYFALTKPGISVMSGATALAGFVLGSRGVLDVDRLVHTVIGTLLVSAGACALNMLIEIDVDARMRRTEKRPLPDKRLQPGEALLFGTLLAVAGILYLSGAVNLLAAALAGTTFSVYLYLYTPLKKVTTLCTAVGAVAGALPPVMGWAAATGRLGVEAAVLFAILFFWQYPHFLALGWMYRDDYARAGLRMLPAPEGDGAGTARRVLLHSAALLAVSVLPTVLGLTGRVYLAAALVLGFAQAVAGAMFYADRSAAGARRLFFATILYLPLLVAVMLANRLPAVS